MIKFPQNFLWGAATSSYQVEGDNANADWWPWEKKAGHENSGKACRHYELYEQDFDLARGLNHNAHRLSIEWSRIEPQEGKFARQELEHYVKVILALRSRGIEPVVTLHHFTNPIWFSADGGWEDRRCVARFLRYCDLVVNALAKHVRYWVTINEPTILVSHAYLFGWWPPQGRSFWRMKFAYDNFLHTHLKTYRLIHKIYKDQDLQPPLVSVSQHISAMVPCGNSFRNRWAASLRDKLYGFDFIEKAARWRALDFIGLNYYSRQLVDVTSWWPGNLLMETCTHNHDPARKNTLGWDIYPQGLYEVLLKLKKYALPVMVTENGICTSDDNARWEFVRDHLQSVHRAMEQGVEVSGYLYWSLLDNFEWDKGFGPRFGMIGMDYSTQQRTVRDSARKFAQVCQTGVLT